MVLMLLVGVVEGVRDVGAVAGTWTSRVDEDRVAARVQLELVFLVEV